MQLVHCTVNLAGDPRKQVRRVYVSVPEILVLRRIHGDDALIEFEYAGERKGEDEIGRLKSFYGGKQETAELIDSMFPGARPNVPALLSDVGLEDVATPEAIEAFEAKKAKQDEFEAKQAKKRETARRKRENLEALAEAAAVEESEIIRPPKTSKKRPDALMG